MAWGEWYLETSKRIALRYSNSRQMVPLAIRAGYRVGQIKRGQCSFFRRSKARFREFLASEITVHLRTLRSIKIKYFSPQGDTKTNDLLSSSILAVLLITFTLKRFY